MSVVENSVKHAILDVFLLAGLCFYIARFSQEWWSVSLPLSVAVLMGVSFAFYVFTTIYRLFYFYKFWRTQLAFDRQGLEVRTADRVARHSWGEVRSVLKPFGLGVTKIMDKDGEAIFVVDRRARGYPKLSAWLNVFPNRARS